MGGGGDGSGGVFLLSHLSAHPPFSFMLSGATGSFLRLKTHRAPSQVLLTLSHEEKTETGKSNN